MRRKTPIESRSAAVGKLHVRSIWKTLRHIVWLFSDRFPAKDFLSDCWSWLCTLKQKESGPSYGCELPCLRLVDYWLGEWVSSAVVNNLSLLCGESHCEFSVCLKFGLHRYSFSSRTKKINVKTGIKEEVEIIILWRKVKAFQTTLWLTAGGIAFKKNVFFLVATKEEIEQKQWE